MVPWILIGTTGYIRKMAADISIRTRNINVGCLGHVDSGKTSLGALLYNLDPIVSIHGYIKSIYFVVAALSTSLSTAALDKHPQSKARGITLDLGFSSFTSTLENGECAQFTLVDCPGHASLVKTVVGGAQIIDMMLLVVDITKGIQPQTAECIVIGEITTDCMIVALNKIDLIEEEKRVKYIKKATKMVQKTLSGTSFRNVPVVAVSARNENLIGIESLEKEMIAIGSQIISKNQSIIEKREGPFMMHIDHCFGVKGQGTVVTGTVAAGHVSVGQVIEFPLLATSRRVKSIQAFKKPVQKASFGDRIGMCISNLSSSQLERGVACEPGSMLKFTKAIARVEKVRFYPNKVLSKKKLHIMIGHSTTMGLVEFFGMPRFASKEWLAPELGFSMENDYLFQQELYGYEGRPIGESEEWYTFSDASLCHSMEAFHGPQWALITFEDCVIARKGDLLLGAKLDTDLDSCTCRISMSGKIVHVFDGKSKEMPSLFKVKSKEGVIDRIENDGLTAICSGFFGENSVMNSFIGMLVRGPNGNIGTLQSPYGRVGQCKVVFRTPLPASVCGQKVALKYKKYVYKERKIEQ